MFVLNFINKFLFFVFSFQDIGTWVAQTHNNGLDFSSAAQHATIKSQFRWRHLQTRQR